MTIKIGFQDQELATGSWDGRQIQWTGPNVPAVERLVRSFSQKAQGEDLLRLLLQKLRGHTWAVQID